MRTGIAGFIILGILGQSLVGGAYVGPPGPEIIRSVLKMRRDRGLPDIEIEERNHDKSL